MTQRTLAECEDDIGREAIYSLITGAGGGAHRPGYTLKIRVRVCNVKVSWGKMRYKIEPLAGEGKAWVMADRIEVLPTMAKRKDWGRDNG